MRSDLRRETRQDPHLPRMIADIGDRSALLIHDVDIHIASAITHKGDFRAIWREGWIRISIRMLGQILLEQIGAFPVDILVVISGGHKYH